MGPHKLSLEDIKGQTDRKVIRLRYKDIFGNGFESSRQVWLEGANPVIGPLQISPIQKEEE